MVSILKRFDIIIFFISIGLHVLCIIGALLACKNGGNSKLNYYTLKWGFMVEMDDELVDIQKKHKEVQYVMVHKLSSLLAINKEYIKIGALTTDARDCEVEIIHVIPDGITNDTQYVHSMYDNQMNAVSKLIKEMYGLITDITVSLSSDGHAFMKMTNTNSYKNMPMMNRVITNSMGNRNKGEAGGMTPISPHSQIELITSDGNVATSDGYGQTIDDNVDLAIETDNSEDREESDNMYIQNTMGVTKGGDDEENESENEQGLYDEANRNKTGGNDDQNENDQGANIDALYDEVNRNKTAGDDGNEDMNGMYDKNNRNTGTKKYNPEESVEDVEWIYEDYEDEDGNGDNNDEMYQQNEEVETNQGYHETMGHTRVVSNGYGDDIDI